MQYLTTFVLSYLTYLFLVWSGSMIEIPEFIVGAVVAAVVSLIATRWLCSEAHVRMINPSRWFDFIRYVCGPFFIAMAKANIDVAIRIFTGELRPGIVRISPNLKSDLAITLLANSITLTPGTLTVDVDEETGDLFIHWLYVLDETPEISQVCGDFPEWARRIAE